MPKSSVEKNVVKILPESLINKIAAGEVVERPSSVVKELLENSIDAGSTEINVTVKNGGKELISIIDNGSGMNKIDAKLSFERHATSKINIEEDLFKINTLGFRGEALAAIASVSHFELLTCDNQNQSGTRLYIKGGVLEEEGKVGFPKGTKISVEKLFFNTPARKKFLKTTATEIQHIQQHFIQKALSHPNIHFRLTHNKQILFNFGRCKALEVRIEQIFGEEFKEILMPVKHEATYLKFDGYISFVSKPRASRRWQYVFVNGRNVRSTAINHGIYDGYGSFLGKNQHPAFFINININPSEIDVNVHPAKTEIRFRNSHLIHTILVDQISRFLKDVASRRFFGHDHLKSKIINFEPTGQMELPIKNSSNLNELGTEKKFKKNIKSNSEKINLPRTSYENLAHFEKSFSSKNILPDSKTSQLSNNYEDYKKSNDSKIAKKTDELNFMYEVKAISNMSPYPNYPKKIKLLGQFLNRYIIADNIEELICFDQKLFLEKLLYIFYSNAVQKKEVINLSFNNPILIEFSSKETETLKMYIEDLILAGFSISHFGKNAFSIYSRPEILKEENVENVIRKIISSLIFSKKRDVDEKIHRCIYYNVAANVGLNFEKELSIDEKNFLLAKWEELGNPFNSINNNPMFFKITKEDFEKKFK